MLLLIRKFYLYITRISTQALFIVSLGFLIGSAMIIRVIEPTKFPTFLDGLWWVVVTAATVGYGDLFPTTELGRAFGIFVILFGVGLIGLVFGKVGELAYIRRKQREEGKLAFEGSEHVLVIGWSEKADHAIQEILAEKKTEVVVIDNLEKARYLHERLHYIRGNASDERVLDMANLREAKACLIFADDSLNDLWLIDCKTLMIATAVERVNPAVFSVTEIELEHNIPNFNHLKVDKIIHSHKVIASLAIWAYKGEKN
jgi:voltage-gated potassium channel